jgi:hypothetical protein
MNEWGGYVHVSSEEQFTAKNTEKDPEITKAHFAFYVASL